MPYAPTIVASAIDWTICTQTGYGVPLYIVMEIVRQEHFDQVSAWEYTVQYNYNIIGMCHFYFYSAMATISKFFLPGY
jgi:hypothetical protein